MIKWEHSIFALPFALTGAVLAAGGVPALPAALLDRGLHDLRPHRRHELQPLGRRRARRRKSPNPHARHSRRAALKSFVGWFTAVAALVFLVAAAQLNRLTLLLSPVALAVVLGYSYAKRFTRLSHLVLGLALGIAPSAAWVAVRGTVDPRILVLTAIVICWVGGFDVLYACQDAEHDRRVGLKSLPAALGIAGAFWVARVLHLAMLALSLWLIHLFALGPVGVGWAGASLRRCSPMNTPSSRPGT